MQDDRKTKAELIEELEALRQRVAENEVFAVERKRAEGLAQKAWELAENIVDTVREPLLVLDPDLRVISASRSFCQVFHVTQEESEGQLLYDLGNGQWDIPALRKLLEEILPQNTRVNDFEVEHEFEDIGQRIMLLNARRIYRETNNTTTILLAIGDITERKRDRAALYERVKELSCLYGIAEMVEREGSTLDEIYQETANILPQSWQYPEITCAKISLGDSEFTTANFTHSNWRLSADIRAHGSVAGKVEVAYLEERAELDGGPFLREEQQLIDGVAERLGRITERKRAEEALAESAARLSATLLGIGDAVISTDAKGCIDLINPVAQALTGWSQEEGVGRSVREVFHIVNEETGDEVESPVAKVLAKGKVVGLANHTILIAKDGSKVPIDDSGAPIIGEDGLVSGVVLVFRDITERKKAEKALNIAEERYRSLVAIMTSAVWATNEVGAFVERQYQWEEFTGQPWEEHKEWGWSNAIHPDDRDRVKKLWTDALEKKTTYYSSGRMIRPNGKYCYYEAVGAPLLASDGSIREWVGTVTDITERKRAEEMLRASEAKNRTLVENLPQKIFYKDTDSVFVFMNDNFVRDFNLAPEEMLGKKGYEWWPKEITEKYIADDQRIMASGETEDIEESYFERGEERFVETVKTPVRDDAGKVIGLLGIFWDITERKRAEEELRTHREHLEELVGERTAKLAKECVAHKQAREEVERRAGRERIVMNAMAGREIRMAELKKAIKKLRAQLEKAGITPVADDRMTSEWEEEK